MEFSADRRQRDRGRSHQYDVPDRPECPFHWKNRRLSTRELCRLQTFPDDYEIAGGRSAVQRQLGNAVPAALAELLGWEIRRQLLGEKLSPREPTLLPAKRSDTPPPELVSDVPECYRKLIGDHEAHPGTGKGYAAVGRIGL